MSNEEGMMQCEYCEEYAHGLTTVQEMYSVCETCLSTHESGGKDGDTNKQGR